MTTNREYIEQEIEKGGRWRKGSILAFRGSWGSGLGTLVLDTGAVHCENAATVRALDACFGDVIGPGHTVNQEAIAGQEVYYCLDEMGLILEAFVPTSDESLDCEREEESNG